MNRVIDLQSAYVLHTRAYRETSVIAELWTCQQGRLAVCARGVRGPKSKVRGLMQPFHPLWITWSGRGELATLNKLESAGSPFILAGSRMVCGLYLNELLLRLLARHDPHPDLYTHYTATLEALSQTLSDPQHEQIALRCFELELLKQLGYGLAFTEALNGDALAQDKAYRFIPGHGFIAESATASSLELFSGSLLTSIAKQDFSDWDVLRAAKRILRTALQYYLGDKPLMSRELLRTK